MIKRHASAQWEGTIKTGNGTVKTESGALDGAYSFGTRFENQPGTNPEELIGAAHAGCFSMALSGAIEKAGFTPQSISTKAEVSLEKGSAGFKITTIQLSTEVSVPDMGDNQFQELAQSAKTNCPVSQALVGVDINLTAKLVS